MPESYVMLRKFFDQDFADSPKVPHTLSPGRLVGCKSIPRDFSVKTDFLDIFLTTFISLSNYKIIKKIINI